jgi:hypothetical protein
MAGLDWDEFERLLTIDLINLPARHVVMLGDHPYLVTFSQLVDHIAVETVSNHWLTGQQRLTPEQEAQLAAAGWQPDSPEHNWWHRLDFPYSSAAAGFAAGLACRTLRIFGQDIATLGYYAWSDRTGRPVELPSLRELHRHADAFHG